jgi:hypothetical protein
MQNSKVSGQTGSRQTVKTKGPILMTIVLFGALLVPANNVKAQVECLGKCERQLALCIASGGGEEPGGCVAAYEACVDGCLGSTFMALFG